MEETLNQVATATPEPSQDPGTTVPQPATDVEAPATEPSQDSLDTLLAEAEQRGYLRGRNESIHELMTSPHGGGDTSASQPVADEAEILILNNIRPSIWD